MAEGSVAPLRLHRSHMIDEAPTGQRQAAIGPIADQQVPDGPRLIKGDDVKCEGSEIGGYSALREDSDPQSRLDHAADPIEAVDLDAEADMAIVPARLSLYPVLERTAFLQTDVIILQGFDQAHRMALSNGMAFGATT